MTRKEPKVLGFYKEKGDEEWIGELKGSGDNLYVEIPSGLRNRMEIVVGNKVRILLDSVIDRNENIVREINKEVICEVIGYWNELYLPKNEVNRYCLMKGEVIGLTMKSVIQFDVDRMA